MWAPAQPDRPVTVCARSVAMQVRVASSLDEEAITRLIGAEVNDDKQHKPLQITLLPLVPLSLLSGGGE